MPKLIAEACCGSADNVVGTQRAGIHRVELNPNLSLGELTSSLDTLKAAKVETGLPIVAVVRPREPIFSYTAAEFRVALLDTETSLTNGADRIVLGFLNSGGAVNAGHCREMLRPAGKNQTVFHRAINVALNWWTAIDLLYGLSVTRILTSGQRTSISDGTATVVEVIHYVHGRIEILPGGRTRTYNVQEIVSKTGYIQTHIPPHRVCLNLSALGNLEIHFGLPGPHGGRYQILDADEFEKMRNLACVG